MADPRTFFEILTANDWITDADRAVLLGIVVGVFLYTHLIAPTPNQKANTYKAKNMLEAMLQWTPDELRLLSIAGGLTSGYVVMRVLQVMGVLA
jgi:hypothetical protein